MSWRFSRFTAFVSMLCGVVVFFLFRSFPPPETRAPERREGYLVLTMDESQDDRSIREVLVRGGMENFISESSQEIPIDDFGVLKMIPLDSFRDEIETFDPRDDGYAAKLRSFFIRDGKRFLFLPLDGIFGNRTAKLNRQLGTLLGDIPFTFTVLRQRSPVFWYFVLLAAACAAALYLSHSRRLFVFELPVLLAFAWGGSFAFVLAAILSGIWELLREPLGELSASRRYNRGFIDYAGTGFRGLWERLKPFRVNCLLALLFMLFFVVFSAFGMYSPIPLVAGCVCFFFLYFLAFRSELERVRKNRHVLFIPVPLLPFKARTFSLFPLLLPFGAAAALALFLPLVFPAFAPAREKDPAADLQYLVSPEDYYQHIAFENSFSYRTLDQDLYGGIPQGMNPGGGALNQEGYLRYYLGDDGLIAGSFVYAGEAASAMGEDQLSDGLRNGSQQALAPPFPLEKLMDFLIKYNNHNTAGGRGELSDSSNPGFAVLGYSQFRLKEWISVAIILTACILNFLRPGIRPGIRYKKKKKVPVFGDKRIAA